MTEVSNVSSRLRTAESSAELAANFVTPVNGWRRRDQPGGAARTIASAWSLRTNRLPPGRRIRNLGTGFTDTGAPRSHSAARQPRLRRGAARGIRSSGSTTDHVVVAVRRERSRARGCPRAARVPEPTRRATSVTICSCQVTR